MAVSFRLVGDLSDDELDALSRDLVREATDERVQLSLASEPQSAPDGHRGDPFTIGALVMALVTSGSVVALFKLLKSYTDRSEELSVEFKRKDKTPVKIKMKNVSLEKFQAVVREFEQSDA